MARCVLRTPAPPPAHLAKLPVVLGEARLPLPVLQQKEADLGGHGDLVGSLGYAVGRRGTKKKVQVGCGMQTDGTCEHLVPGGDLKWVV